MAEIKIGQKNFDQNFYGFIFHVITQLSLEKKGIYSCMHISLKQLMIDSEKINSINH